MPDKKSDKDNIVIDNIGTDKEEVWITIKDASDLLGYSERHTWRIARLNGWKTKKNLNKLKRKTFVLRKNVEQLYNKERQRQQLNQLNKSDKSDMPDNKSIFDMSGKAMSDKISSLNSQKNLPVLLSEYKKFFTKLQENQTKLLQKVTLWKTSLFWLITLIIITGGVLLYVLSDKMHMLSEQKLTINNQKSLISSLDSNITELSDKLSSMSDNLKIMSDKVIGTQNSLDKAKEKIAEKTGQVNELKQHLSEKELRQIRNKFTQKGE